MVDSMGTSAKVHFNRAVDLYDQFSEQHDLLRISYMALVEKRIALMNPENEVASHDVLKQHVCALNEFLVELMKFAKPVGGKLAKLFSVGLCRNLANCLFIDLSLDMHHYQVSEFGVVIGHIKEILSGMFPRILKGAEWPADTLSKNLFANLRSKLEDIVSIHDEQMNENVNTILKSRTEGVWLQLKNQHEPLGIYTRFEICPESASADLLTDEEDCSPQFPETLEDYFEKVGSLALLSLDLLDFNSFTKGKLSIGALKILFLLQAVYMKLPSVVDTKESHCLNPQIVLEKDSISEFLHQCGMNRENLSTSAVKNFLEEYVKRTNPISVSYPDPDDFRLLTSEEITVKSSLNSYMDSIIVKFIVNTVRICSKSGSDEQSVIDCVTEIIGNLVKLRSVADDCSYFGKYFYLSCALLVQSGCKILLIIPRKIKQLVDDFKVTNGPVALLNSLLTTYLRIIEYVTAGKISSPLLYEYMREVKMNGFFNIFEARFKLTNKDFVMDCLWLMSKIITNIKCVRSDVNGFKGDVHHAEGESSSVHTPLSDPKVCTVAMLSSIMLSLFSYVNSKELKELLSTALLCLTQCRLCCCLSAADVLPYFSIWGNSFLWKNQVLYKKILCFVKNVILVDLSGVEIYYSDDCSECGRESIVMTESEDGDKEWMVKGEFISDSELVDVDMKKVQLVPDIQKDYLQIKWKQGLVSYCSGLDVHKQNIMVQQHFYQILVQSKRLIRHLLYKKIYEPSLKRILNDFRRPYDKETRKHLMHSFAYVFRAIHYIIISDNSSLHYTLSYVCWGQFLEYFATLKCRDSLPLACAMYSYVGALVMSDNTAGKVKDTPLLEEIPKFFFSHFIQKNILWCETNYGEKEALHVKLLGVATVYSTMEEFCTFTNFRSVHLEAKLGGDGETPVPVQTLLWTLKQLSTTRNYGGSEETDDVVLRYILLSECPSLCSSLLRSLMMVVSLCGNMNDHIMTVMNELPKLKDSIKAAEPLWAPFLRNMLGVNFMQLPSYMSGLAETSSDDFSPFEAGWEHHISKLYHQKGKRNQRKECPQFLDFCLRSITWIHQQTKDDCYLGEKVISTEEYVVNAANVVSSYFSLPSLPSWGSRQPEPVNYKETIGIQPPHCQLVTDSLRLVRNMCEEDESLHQFVRPYVMEELLSDYWDVLCDGQKHQAVVKQVLLLWSFFAKQQLATKHLQQFMKLFMEKKPPVRSMVSILRTLLVESIDDVTALAPMGGTDVAALAPMGGTDVAALAPMGGTAVAALAPMAGTDVAALAPMAGTDVAEGSSYKYYSVSGMSIPSYAADGFVMNASAGSANTAVGLHSVREDLMRFNDTEPCGLTLSRAVMLLPKTFQKESKNWSPFINSTTIASWIRVDVERVGEVMKDKSRSSDNTPMKVHLHSAGVKEIHASVFLNLLKDSDNSTVSGYISVDIYRYVAQTKGIKKISKSMTTKTFDFNSHEPWHFVMVNYKNFNPKKKITLNVDVTVDSFVETLTSNINKLGTLVSDLPFVSVGHFCSTENESPLDGVSVSLGNVWVFASDNDGPYRAPILRAFGPSARNFLCPRGDPTLGSFLLKHMGQEMVEAVDDSGQEFVMNMGKILLNEMQGNNFMNSLAMQFNCHSPDVFSMYSKPSASEYSYPVGTPEYTVMYGGPWQSDRPKQRAYGALMELGGVEHLLVMQARIAELNPFAYDYTISERTTSSSSNPELHELLGKTRTFYRTSEGGEGYSVMVKDLTSPKEGTSYGQVQAEALDLLLWSVRNSAALNEQFGESRGYDMIVTLLCSARTDLGLPVMKTLLSHCFSDFDLKPLKADGSEDLQLGVLSQSSYCGLITNSLLLSNLLKYWPAVVYKRSKVTNNGMEGVVKDVCFGTLNSFELLLRVCVLATSSFMDSYRSCIEINSNILLNIEAITTVFEGLKLLHTVDMVGYSIHPDLLGVFLKSLLVEEAQPTVTDRQKLNKAIKVVVSYLQLCVEPEVSVSFKFSSCILSLDGLYDFYRSGLSNENPTSKTQEILHQQMFQKISDTISRPPYDRAPSPDEGFVLIEKKYPEMVEKSLQANESNVLTDDFDITEPEYSRKKTSELSASVKNESRAPSELSASVKNESRAPSELSASIKNESLAPSELSASIGEPSELSYSLKDESCEPSEVSASNDESYEHSNVTASGRRSPPEVCPPDISVQDLADDSASDDLVLLDSDDVRVECYIGDRILTTVVQFLLNNAEDMQLREILRTVFSPQTLCLLANHKSANVRTAVIKILQKVFSKDDKIRDWAELQKLYMNCLENIKHQLFSREATDELVDLTYDIMVSTKQKKSLLPNLFLAVLSRMSRYKDFKSTRKVLDFAHMIANEIPAHAEQIFGMDTLTECLLLSLKSLVEEPAFNTAIFQEMTVAYSNLVRISICVNDVQSVKDHIVKAFLLCHYLKRRDVAVFSRAITIFSSSVINVLAILFAFLNWDAEKGEETLNLLSGSEYSGMMLPLSRDMCQFVLKRVVQGVNPVLKSLEVLSLVQNFFYDLGLLEVSSPVGVTSLHWFMLDLQLVLLKVWDSTSVKASSRSAEKRPHPKPCDLLQLSLRFSSPMRSLLPQMLYLLTHKEAGVEANEALVTRLSGDLNVTRKLFLYCLADESKLGRLIVYNLIEMVKRFYHLPLHSACESLFNLAQSLSNISSQQLSELATNADEDYKNCLKESGKDSDAEMSKSAQQSLRKSVKIHKTHKDNLFLVYNEFLVKHIDLKSLVMNEVQAFEDLLCQCVISWRALASAHSRKSSIWTRNLNAWIELRNNINSDMTRTVLEPQTCKLNDQKYYNLPVSDLPDPFDAVFDNLIPSLPHGETRTTIPRYDPKVEFMAKGIEPVADFKCWVIRHGTDFFGNLFMFQKNLVFNGTKQVFSCGTADEVYFNSSFSIDKDSIREIRLMKYRLEEVAIEVYLKDGISWFFALESEEDRTSLMNNLKTHWSKLATSADELKEAANNWIDRKISNFDYLMKLNLISGRTYNDLCQYPVFPFVLSLYSSDGSSDNQTVLNLNADKSFRILEYPLPAQLEDKKKKLEERYKNCADPNIPTKYHYSSFYSNSTIVQNYLIRVPPFTLYHVKLQGGRFDNPDRIFHSVSKTYKISVTENDSREAIPELYYLPELFTNHQQFAFEVREQGDRVDDVKVPQWCNSPRDFVLVHRAALESSKVTEKLNNWIDLVFGCKQSGEKAFKSYNTYHPYCYSEIMETTSESKELFKAFARCVGDAPRQLFKDPHPRAKPQLNRKSPFLESLLPMQSLVGMEWGSFAFFTLMKDKEFTLEPPKKMSSMKNHHIATNVPGDTFYLVSEGVSILHLAEESNHLNYHMVRIDPNDGVVRAQNCKPSELSSEVYPVVKIPSHLTVTRFIVDESYLWVGCDTGTVSLYTLQFSNNLQQYECAKVVHLKHHTAAVSAISSLKDFGICVTGDSSGVCCIWDPFKGAVINDPVTVSNGNPISSLLISRTSGEWFSVVNPVTSSGKGMLSLHRINT